MGVLAMARALQRLSSYPLVVLTNESAFPDGTQVVDGLGKLNAQVIPLQVVEMPHHLKRNLTDGHREVAWWKLQIWELTQFEKLIWMDSDAILSRSIDWLFERPWMWAQQDDWLCERNVPKVCSGIMLMYPNRTDYEGLLAFANAQTDLPNGDQQLISDYFSSVHKKPINFLSDVEASFGHCLGKTPSPYINPDKTSVWGVWGTPTFSHKSGGWRNTRDEHSNLCFQHLVAHQLFRVGTLTFNVCHYHPLGSYWRNLLCESAVKLELRMPEVIMFCDDECWHLGKAPDGSDSCGGPLSTTVNYTDYEAGLPAEPAELS